MPDFHDITDPGEFLPEASTPWWVWLLVGCGVVILFIALYFIFKKRAPSKQRQTLLDKARARLEKLKTETTELPPHTMATRISLIIRQYLEAAFDDPALFETNEEFTLRPHALQQLHPDSREPVASHLTELSQIKYAPIDQANNVASLIDQAEEILTNIEFNVSSADATPLGE